MKLINKFIGDLFVTVRFYVAACACIFLYLVSFFVDPLFLVAQICFASFIALFIADYVFLFLFGTSPSADREVNDRLSNGDLNKVVIQVKNNYPFDAYFSVVDELPFQLQERNFILKKKIRARKSSRLSYTLQPKERGLYEFGDIILYTHTRLGLVQRRHTINAHRSVNVYPSFMNLRHYHLLSPAVTEGAGSRRMRKIGQSMEFEQIKDYVLGDDIRTVNWKATARRDTLMVNSYVDERSQQVFCIIDKGRLMKMPFGGLSLLDYAINSTLALTNTCLQKQDRIGLMTCSNKMGAIVAPDRKPIQREKIMQALYKEQTAFLETDFELLYMQVRHKIKQRSLLILFTNFESLNGLQRQLPYLRSMARHHLLLVVFFENTELQQLSVKPADNIQDVYVRVVAEKFVFEKKLVVKELQKYGIASILSSPENLTINTINKYLQLKAQQVV